MLQLRRDGAASQTAAAAVAENQLLLAVAGARLVHKADLHKPISHLQLPISHLQLSDLTFFFMSGTSSCTREGGCAIIYTKYECWLHCGQLFAVVSGVLQVRREHTIITISSRNPGGHQNIRTHRGEALEASQTTANK
jgi:hypothetical protein